MADVKGNVELVGSKLTKIFKEMQERAIVCKSKTSGYSQANL